MPANLIGVLLRNRRAGAHLLAWAKPELTPPADSPSLALTSPAFDDGSPIPERHKGRIRGHNVSPALAWSPPPAGTVELALVVQDPDVPFGSPAVHALTRGIEPTLTGLPEDALSDPSPITGVVHGAGGLGRRGWSGPLPIPSHGPHRYVFQLFALDTALELPERFGLADAVAAMSGRVIARGRLEGTYEIR